MKRDGLVNSKSGFLKARFHAAANPFQSPVSSLQTQLQTLSIIFLLSSFFSPAFSAARIWVGGVNSDWATDANWSPAAQPTALDDAVFNSGSANCDLANGEVKSITFTAGYTGGFNFGTNTLNVYGNGDFRSGGTVSNTSGKLVFKDFTSGTTFIPKSGATMPTIEVFPPNEADILELSTVALATDLLDIRKGRLVLGNDSLTHLAMTLTLTSGTGIDFGNSTLQVQSNVDFSYSNFTLTAGTGTLEFIGGTSGNFIPKTGAAHPHVSVNKSGTGKVTLAGNLISGNLIILDGTLDLANSGYTHTVADISTMAGAILDFGDAVLQTTGNADLSSLAGLTPATGSLAFTAGAGTQIFSPDNGAVHPGIRHSGAGTLQLSGSTLIANSFTQTSGILDFNGQDMTIVNSGSLNITKGGATSISNLGGRTITVAGDAYLAGTCGAEINLNPGSGWTIAVTGGLTAGEAVIANSNASASAGTTVNCTDGSGNTNWTFTNGKIWTGAVDGNWSTAGNWCPSGAPALSDAVIFDASGSRAVTLDGSATIKKLTLNQTWSHDFNFSNSTLTVTGDADLRTGSTITTGAGGTLELSPAVTSTLIPKSGAAHPALVKSGEGTSVISINGAAYGSLTINAGALDLGDAGLTHTTASLATGGGALDFGTSTLLITAGNADLSLLSGVTPATGMLGFTAGVGTQVFTPNNGSIHPSISHTAAGTLQLSTNALTAKGFTQTAGILDFNGQNIATVSSGNFSITNGTAATLTNLAGRTLTIAGNATLNGQAADLLNLNAGSVWNLNVTGMLTSDYADIAGSNASGGSAGMAAHSADGGGNSNWNFGALPIAGYTADNEIPSAQVAQATDGSGVITIQFRVRDTDANNVTLNTFQYSVDNGSLWSAPANNDASLSLSADWEDNGSHYAAAVDWSGTVYFFTFGTKHADVSGLNGADQPDVRVRFMANDGYSNSLSPATSQAFQVDGLDPAPAAAIHFEGAPVSGTSITLDAAFTEANPNTTTYHFDLNGGGYDAGTAGTADNADPAPQVVTTAAINGDDYFSGIKCVHVDDFGNTGTSESTTDVFVKPYTPQAPSVSAPTSSTVDVTVNTHASSALGISYAIYITPDSGGNSWVQADGSVGAAEAWQTAEAWGTKTVTGLSPPLSQYSIQTKSRNSVDNATESDFSTAAQAPNTAPIAGYTSDDIIPSAQLSQSTDGNGIMTVTFRVKDLEHDLVTLESFAYSDDGGTNWYVPGNADTSGALAGGWPSNSGGKFSSAADWSGTAHTFTFNTKHGDVTASHSLVSVDIANFQVRFKVSDAMAASALAV